MNSNTRQESRIAAAKAIAACVAVAFACVAPVGAGTADKAAKTKISFTSATKKLAKTPAKATAGNPFTLTIGVKPSSSNLRFTATGLPKGLKIIKKTGKIKGKPTVPGSFTAKVKVKNPKGTTISQKVRIKVSVPKWAKGDFYGYAFPDGGNEPGGYLAFKVGSTGKVSGKVKYKGTTYKFTSKYAYCSAKEARFSPDAMKLGSKTLDPGQIVVTSQQDRIEGMRVVEAVNKNSIFIAQKTAKLVRPGGEVEILHEYSYTFKEKDSGSGLGADDRLKVSVANDAVKVSGWYGGKKLAVDTLPLFVTSRKVGKDDVTYSLCVYIYDHVAKYRKWLFFNLTITDSGELYDFDPEFRN